MRPPSPRGHAGPARTGFELAENMGFFDFGTIFFLIAAVVIFFQLRNVLGRRTGNERPPFDPYSASRTREADAAQKPVWAKLRGIRRPQRASYRD